MTEIRTNTVSCLFLCISGLSHIHNPPIAVCLPAVLDKERHMYSSYLPPPPPPRYCKIPEYTSGSVSTCRGGITTKSFFLKAICTCVSKRTRGKPELSESWLVAAFPPWSVPVLTYLAVSCHSSFSCAVFLLMFANILFISQYSISVSPISNFFFRCSLLSL